MNDISQPARALHPRYYNDPAVFEREKEHIFFKTWQVAGHVSQLQQPGDYVTFSVCDQDLFAIRGTDGTLRAFYNVCQHRAHELLEGSGNKTLISCPYHAWTYETDGKLRKARNSETTPGFDASEICLTEVRLETFCGFVFVNLDDNAKSMADTFPGIEQQIRDFNPNVENVALAHTHSVSDPVNWKVSVENYNECYHCRVVHKAFTSSVVSGDSYHIETNGYSFRHIAKPSNKSAYDYGDAVNDQYSSWYLWPNFGLQVYPGNIVNTYRWHTDQVKGTTVYREWWLPNGEISDDHANLIELDRTTTFDEDLALINSVQRGLNSRGYKPGQLVIDPARGANSEHTIKALNTFVLDALGEG